VICSAELALVVEQASAAMPHEQRAAHVLVTRYATPSRSGTNRHRSRRQARWTAGCAPSTRCRRV
jgi:hypothetical protein